MQLRLAKGKQPAQVTQRGSGRARVRIQGCHVRSHDPLLPTVFQDFPSALSRSPQLLHIPGPLARAPLLCTPIQQEAQSRGLGPPSSVPQSVPRVPYPGSLRPLPEAGRDACPVFYLATNCLHFKGIPVPQSPSASCPDACFCMKGHWGRGTSERGATVSPMTALKA